MERIQNRTEQTRADARPTTHSRNRMHVNSVHSHLQKWLIPRNVVLETIKGPITISTHQGCRRRTLLFFTTRGESHWRPLGSYCLLGGLLRTPKSNPEASVRRALSLAAAHCTPHRHSYRFQNIRATSVGPSVDGGGVRDVQTIV